MSSDYVSKFVLTCDSHNKYVIGMNSSTLSYEALIPTLY